LDSRKTAGEKRTVMVWIHGGAFVKQIRWGYGERADLILSAYPHSTDAEAARSAADVFREFAFAGPTWTWARLQSRKGKGRAFVYYFDHRTPDSPDGANHGAEVSYVFGNHIQHSGL
jgi:para-nitrobenzyl esterase